MEIRTLKIWRADDVRSFCIKERLYTRGDNPAYEKMLTFVDENEPTPENIYKTAKDILEHSDSEHDEQSLMFQLNRECVYEFFEIEE